MAETLKIENFGPIKKANLKLGKTTVFIGEQSSGKSTIAKLIHVFRNAEFLYRSLLNPSDDFLSEYLLDFGILNYLSEDTNIQYSNNLYTSSFSQETLKTSLQAEFYWLNELVESEQKEQLNKKGTVFHFGRNNSIVLKHIYSNSPSSIYIPAERIFFSTLSKYIFSLLRGNVPFPQFLLIFGSELEQIRSRVSSFDITPLSVKYISDNDNDWIIDKNGNKITLLSASSGIQVNVPLFIALERSNSDLSSQSFIVEEPELNLFPSTQLKLINTLGEKCTKGGNQLVITTHSPYVLTALNNLLFAYKTAAKKPDAKKKINKIIPEASWLNPDEFKAYYVGKGTVKSITDKDTGLIGENHLDDASYEIGDAFDALMEIYKD